MGSDVVGAHMILCTGKDPTWDTQTHCQDLIKTDRTSKTSRFGRQRVCSLRLRENYHVVTAEDVATDTRKYPILAKVWELIMNMWTRYVYRQR